MRYVQRDADGLVTATFAQPQPGVAEEALAEDHPEVLAYRERSAGEGRVAARQLLDDAIRAKLAPEIADDATLDKSIRDAARAWLTAREVADAEIGNGRH